MNQEEEQPLGKEYKPCHKCKDKETCPYKNINHHYCFNPKTVGGKR